MTSLFSASLHQSFARRDASIYRGAEKKILVNGHGLRLSGDAMSRTIYEFTHLPEASTGLEGECVPNEMPLTDATPRVGVIYNPRSHRNKGQDLDCDISPHIFIAQPGEREQLPSALCELARSGIDLLVINGGDGTVRDVLTCGMSVFGDNWPAIAGSD